MGDINLTTLLPSIIEAAENSNYIIFIKDENDNFVYLNKAACLITDTDLETIKSKNFQEGSKEKEIYDSFFANDIDVLKTQRPKSELYSLGKGDPLSKDSCYYFTKQPIKDDEGKEYILGFGVEITNRLVENSTLNFFKDVLNQMTDSFMITEAEFPFHIRYVNKAFLQLSGYKKFEDVIGKTPTQVLTKFSSEDEIRKEFNERLSKKEVCQVVLTNKNLEGKIFKSHITVVPISNEYFVGIQRDITETFNKNEALRRNKNQLAAIFNNISSYLWLLSPDLKILQMNRSAQIQGKYANNRYKLNAGLCFSEGRWWKANQESKNLIDITLQQVLSRGIKQEVVVDFLNANDYVRKIRLTINPNRDQDGDIDYIVVEGVDITALEKEKAQYRDIAKAQAEVSLSSPDKVEAWKNTGLEGKQLERVVRMETTVDGLVPKVENLSKAVNDPETGLVVNVNGIKEDLSKLVERTDSTEGLLQVLGIAQKIPTFLKYPIVKYALIILLGSSAINTVGITFNKLADWINKIDTSLVNPK